MKIKICAVQSKICNSQNKNLADCEKLFKYAHKNKCHIICFPEIFLTGPFNIPKYDKDFVNKAKKTISGLCKNYKIHAVMGSIVEKIGINFSNISYLFDDNGKIIGNYKKIHLVKNSEAMHLKQGKKAEVFKTKLGNIGIQICRDLLYPEITRELMLKGAEFVFCPSFWSLESSSYLPIYNKQYFLDKEPREVDYLVSARAIENEIVFVYVNAGGEFKTDKSFDVLLGRTQIAMPFYGTVKRIENNKERILIYEVDKTILKDAKRVYYIEDGL